MSIVKRVFKNTAFLAVSEIVHKILFFFLIIYATRILGPENFGRYSFAFALGYFMTLFVDLGISTYLTRELSRDKAYKKNLSGLFTLKIILAIGTYVILALGVIIAGYSGMYLHIVLIAAMSVFIDSIVMFLQSICRAFEELHYVSITKIIQTILTFILGFYVLMNLNGNLFYFVVSFLISSIIAFIITLVIVIKKYVPLKISFESKSFLLWKKVLIASMPFSFTLLFGMIFYRIDTIMLSWIKGDISVGLYNAAYQIVGALLFIPGIYCIVVFPLLAKYFKNNNDRFNRILRLSVKYFMTLALPIGFGITVLAQRIILFLYDTAYLGSAITLQILIWTAVSIFFVYLFSNTLIAMDKEKIIMRTTGIATVINVVLNLLLIWKYDLNGAAIATVVTQSYICINYAYHIHKQGHPLYLFRSIVRPALACAVMSVIVLTYYDMNMFLIIPIGAIAYGIVFLLLKGISKEDINLIKEIIGMKNK